MADVVSFTVLRREVRVAMLRAAKPRPRARRTAECEGCGYRITTLNLVSWDLGDGDHFVAKQMRSHGYSCPVRDARKRPWHWVA